MNDLKILFEKVLEVKEKYDNERAKKRFNIFTALHKERDEVNLHSRTITYLLSPDSGHGMKSKFAEIFIRNILEIPNEIFSLEGLEVFPSENSKSEYKEIDILLINRQRKQAIIIENKIDAKDSNHEGDDVLHGYSGQLERYYNTIKTGLDKNNNKIWDFQCNTVSVYYLTLYKQPSKESIGNLKKVRILYYKDEIRKWLTSV